MELAQICAVKFEELRYEKIDYFIAASGYQTRSTYLASLNPAPHAKKFLLSISEDNFPKLRQTNESIFANLGFDIYKASPDKPDDVDKLIKKICDEKRAEHITLLVDYSCMPRLWFTAILDSINRNDFKAGIVSVFFAYTPKKFSLDAQKTVIKYLGPMMVPKDQLKKSKPPALIVGMDNSCDLTLELINRIHPAQIVAFIPENSLDEEYTHSVVENNKKILDMIDPANVISYEALHPEIINSVLTSKCLDLRLNHEVVIVPQGPKSFSLISALVSIRYPDIKIWQITTTGRPADPNYGAAITNPMLLKVTFCADDEDEM